MRNLGWNHTRRPRTAAALALWRRDDDMGVLILVYLSLCCASDL